MAVYREAWRRVQCLTQKGYLAGRLSTPLSRFDDELADYLASDLFLEPSQDGVGADPPPVPRHEPRHEPRPAETAPAASRQRSERWQRDKAISDMVEMVREIFHARVVTKESYRPVRPRRRR